MAGNARRQCWHPWQLRQRDVCKLQNPKEVIGSESHPLRQTHLRRDGSRRSLTKTPHGSDFLRPLGCPDRSFPPPPNPSAWRNARPRRDSNGKDVTLVRMAWRTDLALSHLDCGAARTTLVQLTVNQPSLRVWRLPRGGGAGFFGATSNRPSASRRSRRMAPIRSGTARRSAAYLTGAVLAPHYSEAERVSRNHPDRRVAIRRWAERLVVLQGVVRSPGSGRERLPPGHQWGPREREQRPFL